MTLLGTSNARAAFSKWLGKRRCGYALSMGQPESGSGVPADLFDEHCLLDNQTSPVRRLNGGGAPRVREGLYVRIKRHEEGRSSTLDHPVQGECNEGEAVD